MKLTGALITLLVITGWSPGRSTASGGQSVAYRGDSSTGRITIMAPNETSVLPAVEMQDIAYGSEQSEVGVRWNSFKGGRYQVDAHGDLARLAVLASNYPPAGATRARTVPTHTNPSSVGMYPAGMPLSKPNVLLIIGDDLRDMAALPGPNTNRVIMPNLDRLAKSGMRFDRAFAQYPVCNPSRTSFLTGLRPDTTGVLDNSLFFRNTSASNAVTLPQLFRQNGYQTLSLGKVFHNVSPNTIDWLSWDVCKILTDSSYAIDAIGKTGPSNNMTGGALSWCYWIKAGGNDNNQMDGKIAVDATNRLGQAQTRPFFMAVGLNKPHDPFIAPARYFDLFPTNLLNVHVDPAGKSNDVSLAIPPGSAKAAFAAFTDKERLEFLRAYYACAAFEDAQIGRLLDALDQNGLWQNTIVIFVSDHGYHLGERAWWNKVTVFELCSRVPVYVYVPGLKLGGQRCQRLVELIDIYPTLADLAGLTLPSALPGTSFRPLLTNPQQPWKSAAYTQVERGTKSGYSVRTEQWRYTKWSTGEIELYNHDTDSGEWYNLASNPSYANIVNQLDALLPPP